MTSEYIGILLWQDDDRDKLVSCICDNIDRYPNLTIEQAVDLPFKTKDDRTEFVREVYPGEEIPDDNPKITSNAVITLIVIKDNDPKIDYITTGSGKSVLANISGFNVKKDVRGTFHWKYIHSTDNVNDFVHIGRTIVSYFDIHDRVVSDRIRHLVNSEKTIRISLSELGSYYNSQFYYIQDSVPYRFATEYLQSSKSVMGTLSDKFINSKAYKDYEQYLAVEREMHGECDHSVKNFCNLIDGFDYQKYNYSTSRLVRCMALYFFNDQPEKLKQITEESIVQKLLESGISDFSLESIKQSPRCFDAFRESVRLLDPEGKVFFLNDGLHRASILLARGITGVNVRLKPLDTKYYLFNTKKSSRGLL